jgi:hypothetical protein
MKIVVKMVEAGPIERQKEHLDIGPGWRSALFLGHDQTAGVMGGLTEQLALKDTRLSERIGNAWSRMMAVLSNRGVGPRRSRTRCSP